MMIMMTTVTKHPAQFFCCYRFNTFENILHYDDGDLNGDGDLHGDDDVAGAVEPSRRS